MSIESTQGPSQAASVVTDFKARKQVKAADSPRGSEGDTAGITDDARELGRARDAVEATPEAREAQVRALQAAIANGTYEADSEEIARRLLDRGF